LFGGAGTLKRRTTSPGLGAVAPLTAAPSSQGKPVRKAGGRTTGVGFSWETDLDSPLGVVVVRKLGFVDALASAAIGRGARKTGAGEEGSDWDWAKALKGNSQHPMSKARQGRDTQPRAGT